MAILLSLSELTLLVLWSLSKDVAMRRTSIVAYATTLAASVVLAPLSYLEHSRSVRPSVLLNAYLFITVLLDAVTLRTLWLMHHALPEGVVITQTLSFGLKALLLILEAQSKEQYCLNEKASRSPEDFSGLYSQSLFWWLNVLMRRGCKFVLQPTDLYPISDDVASEHLSNQFNQLADSGEKLLSSHLSLRGLPIALRSTRPPLSSHASTVVVAHPDHYRP